MDLKHRIAGDLGDARRRTEALVAPVDDARLMAQHDPIMSPLAWDYGHIAVFEELWLVQQLGGAAPIDSARMHLYDAFENPRRVRGSLPLMTRAQASAYRDTVDARVLELLEEVDLDGQDRLLSRGFVYDMIVQHEHQHCETMLQTLQLMDGGYLPDLPAPPAVEREVRPEMVDVPGGRYSIGSPSNGPYDNERPRHEVELAPFRIGRFPVTCGQFRDFIEDGGYRRKQLWTPTGWTWRSEHGIEAPKHWHRDGEAWRTERFGHQVPVDWRTPVLHVCWYEADAFCRWAGGRLPTEHEWEVAATWDPASGRARRYPWGDEAPAPALANLDQRMLGCAPVGAYPAGASALGCEQMVGDAWEWTASHFLPYPGFSAFPYPEYSQVFFGSEYRVLRGASWAARGSVARATFRNWDLPVRRQIFAGFRCAADGEST